MRVEHAESPGAEWDRFVEATPGGALGQASAWLHALRIGYDIETVPLVARDSAGAIRGVLPLARFRSLGGRRALVSLPFLDAAGVLADDPEAERALLDAACALGPCELRQMRPPPGAAVGPAARVDLHLSLGGGPDARWQALPAKVRNQVRKATKEGLALAPPDLDLAGAFHGLHCAGMRELGTPPHAERFLRAVLEAFGDRARVLIASDGAQPLAGLIAIRFAGAVTVPWASALHSARPRCGNQLVYWEALRWAEECGAAEFGFGRSPRGSGTFRFKRGWGAIERPLYWVHLASDGAAALATSSGDSSLLRALSRIWRRLPPTMCERWGPALRRRIAS